MRAATILFGSLLETTAIPYVPSTLRSASMTAVSRSSSKNSSTRCASTSVSVSERKVWPTSSSAWRSAEPFSMIPLWTTAMSPSHETCGCALQKLGAPWVAHRVCAMPSVPCTGAAATSVSSSTIFPAAFRVSTPLPFMIATPAESYPRYSRRLSPSIRSGEAMRGPM